MNLRIYPFIFCLLSAGACFGQYHYRSYGQMSDGQKKVSQRTYFGVSMPLMNMNIESQYQVNGTTIAGSQFNIGSGGIGMKKALGLIGGSCFKLAELSDNSMVALDVAMSADLYNYHVGSSSVDSGSNKITYTYLSGDNTYVLSALVMRLPIAVMYKMGNEVTLTMSNSAMFSIGAGIAPSIMFANYDGADLGGFKLQPFVVGEVGMWFVKLRAAYYIGNWNFGNTTSDANQEALMTASNSGNAVVSLLFLLYASKWGSENKW